MYHVINGKIFDKCSYCKFQTVSKNINQVISEGFLTQSTQVPAPQSEWSFITILK